MNSFGISNWIIRGTCGFISWRGSAIVSVNRLRICSRPALACIKAFSKISNDRPSHLISICVAVKPSLVPVVLKSISPKWSSSPRISLNTAYLSSPGFLISPIAIPDTGFFIGTPASINANVPAHTVAIDEEPLDSRIWLTKRTVYGKSAGICPFKARHARWPWPISRRPTPRCALASPVQNGGKL